MARTILSLINGPLCLGEEVEKNGMRYHEVLDKDTCLFALAYGKDRTEAKVRAEAIVSNINDQLPE